jgi:hypothetical protein
MLQLTKHRRWRYFLTGDESRFYYTMNHDYMWLPDGAEAPIQSQQIIASPKRILTVFWFPLGFSVVKIMSKRQRFDVKQFISTILSVIAENCPLQTWEGSSRQRVLHFDNASSYTARCTIRYLNRNHLVRALHPPFSPDLASSDFYLFGKVRTALTGATFEEGINISRVSWTYSIGFPATNSKPFLASVSFDWTYASSEPETTSNEGNLLNNFLFFYLELIWTY